MFNSNYVSIKQIADKIKRGKIYKDIPFDSIIDYTIEAMRLIMQEQYFITQPARLKVEGLKTKLPCDFELMIGCAKIVCGSSSYVPMRYGTDTFHSVYHASGSPDLNCSSEYTYTISNNIMHTNFKDGEVFMVYKAIPSDEEGLPLIPDEVNTKLAVEYYIKYRYLDDIASDEAVIERRKKSDEQEYCWYVGKSQAAATNMTMDEYETFANSMSQLFMDNNQFGNRLKDLGIKEHLRIQF